MSDSRYRLCSLKISVGKRQNSESQNWGDKKAACRIFRKTIISHCLVCIRICAYQGVGNVCFLENLVYFVFLTPPFWDLPLCFATENRVLNFDSNIWLTSVQVHEEQYENIKNMQIVLAEQKSITSFEGIWNLSEKCFSCSSF